MGSASETVAILEIAKATYEKSGNYKCVASNGQGEDDNKSFKLTIQGKWSAFLFYRYLSGHLDEFDAVRWTEKWNVRLDGNSVLTAFDRDE